MIWKYSKFMDTSLIYYSPIKLERVVSSLALYLDTDRDFGKSFYEKFPKEYGYFCPSPEKVK